MKFTKMHGIGNDYVYVDTFTQSPPPDPARLAVTMSDRHFGVGSDGLILILPSEVADARMRMFNADGSEGEMCGNGVRCVAKYLYDHGLARKDRVTVETGRGLLSLDLEAEGGKVRRVRVDMGAPILKDVEIPTLLSGEPPSDAPIRIAATIRSYTASRGRDSICAGNSGAATNQPSVVRPSGVRTPVTCAAAYAGIHSRIFAMIGRPLPAAPGS